VRVRSRSQQASPRTFVAIECSTCASGNGITLAQRDIASFLWDNNWVNGEHYFRFTLNENAASGWRKDPQDDRISVSLCRWLVVARLIAVQNWPTATQCEFLEVLRGMSAVKIYADITTEDEVLGLDMVCNQRKPLSHSHIHA
jgi:hypothetical protein